MENPKTSEKTKKLPDFVSEIAEKKIITGQNTKTYPMGKFRISEKTQVNYLRWVIV